MKKLILALLMLGLCLVPLTVKAIPINPQIAEPVVIVDPANPATYTGTVQNPIPVRLITGTITTVPTITVTGKVKITDGTNDVGVTPDGRLKVETTEQVGLPINYYYQATLPAGGHVDLLNIAMGANETLRITTINVTGEGRVTYIIRWGTATQTFDTAGVANTIATIKTSSIMRTVIFPVYQGPEIHPTHRLFIRATSEENVSQFVSVNVCGRKLL